MFITPNVFDEDTFSLWADGMKFPEKKTIYPPIFQRLKHLSGVIVLPDSSKVDMMEGAVAKSS